jgi:hypothetical protein
MQIGITDILDTASIEPELKRKATALHHRREHSNKFFVEEKVYPSWKENMPLATTKTPLVSDEELMQLMHKEHRRYLRKAQEQNYHVVTNPTDAQREEFYTVRSSMGSAKGVGIMTNDTYLAMRRYLQTRKSGNLFLVMEDDHIVAGSIILYRGKELIYLYGASNREHGNHGGHIMLQHEIMKW